MKQDVIILIADDNPTNLKLAGDLLEFEGYKILRARDATEVQATIRETRPALILMDIQMPGMDGLTLTRLIKADPANRDIRIAAMTAFAMKGDREKAMAAGCDGYITKPIDTRQFPEQVAALLAGQTYSQDGTAK
jgi:CheY-like chemotaxis protein